MFEPDSIPRSTQKVQYHLSLEFETDNSWMASNYSPYRKSTMDSLFPELFGMVRNFPIFESCNIYAMKWKIEELKFRNQ